MKHIKPSLLFGAAQGRADLGQTERDHLTNCKNCRSALLVFKDYIGDEAGCRRIPMLTSEEIAAVIEQRPHTHSWPQRLRQGNTSKMQDSLKQMCAAARSHAADVMTWASVLEERARRLDARIVGVLRYRQ